MKLADFEPLQRAIWTNPQLSEPVELLDAGGVVQWAGRAIEVVPSDADVPGTDLARRSSRIRRLAFRREGTPALRRGSRLRWRGVVEVVDGTPSVEHDVLTVTVSPEQARAVVGL